MCGCKLILSCVFVWCNVIFVTSFNIETKNYTFFKGDSGSMFGFTVAIHKDRADDGWVLVGAPEAQSLYQNPNTVSRGGAVYKCRTRVDDDCQEIPFDREGNSQFGNLVLDNKTHQWLGATLSASGQSNGRVVACAPRYVWFTRQRNRRDPVGTCFVSDGDLQTAEEYSPCRTMNWGYHRQGSCQAGFSAAINKVGDRLYVGAPGSYFWQGQLYSVDAHAKFQYTPGFFGNFGYGAKGSVRQQSLETRPAVFSTREGDKMDDNSYMGYSMVVGQFSEGEQYEGIAVGMPRGNQLRGKVLLFTWDLKNYKNLTASRQIGSYFGYSITAADVDGDHRLDLIVGAPMHTEPNNAGKYDVGRIYIFHQRKEFLSSFNSSYSIDGFHSKSRFGHAVSTVGDLNRDGYDDIAVGAPYGGPDGRGAVYIFYGSKKGLRKKFDQVIYAKNIQARVPVNTFGFSLTGGMDLDGNDYPDMAVGAYLSDTAFFFRSRPVVLVDALVRYLTPEKQIDIRETNCDLPGAGSQRAICTDIEFCIKFNGPETIDHLYFNIEYILDSKKPNASRMGFLGRNTHSFRNSVRLYRERQECRRERVFIHEFIRDKLTPLEAEMKYSIIEEMQAESLTRNPDSVLTPVLDLNSPPSKKDFIIVQKNCGPDNICIPDLKVDVTPNVKYYILGSNTKLELDVTVSNFGEDSFETTLWMQFPKGIFYNKIESAPNMSQILCSVENNNLTCDIGNPLPKDKIALFKIILQPSYPEGMASTYDFDIYVNSTNPESEITRENNHIRISIGIDIDASLELRGVSHPSTVYYNKSLYTSDEIIKETDIGPQVAHVYYIRNTGPASIQEAEIFILLPEKTLGGEDLLYLLEQPDTMGDVKCDAGIVNYKNYQVNYYSDPIWDRLRIDTSNVEETNKSTSSIEIGKGISSGVGVENKKGEEEQEFNTGDSSSVIQHRYSENSTNVNTHGTINTNTGEYIYTEAKSTTTWTNGEPHTTWVNITTVKDANGNVLRTYYTNNNTDLVTSSSSGINLSQIGEQQYRSNATKTSNIYSQSGNQNVRKGSTQFIGTGQYASSEARIAEERRRKLEEERRRKLEEERREEEAVRQEERRRLEEQSRRAEEEMRRKYEERQRIEVERQRTEAERQRVEEERRRAQEITRRKEAEERRREEEIRRRKEEEIRRQELWRKQEEERIRNTGWTQSSSSQGSGTKHDQGGVQESGGQDEYYDYDEYSNQGKTSGESHHRVVTGYYDQQGVYHDYPRNPSGQIIYNKTYTIETTDTIPIDLPGGESNQHLGLSETALGGGFTIGTLDLGNAASESSLAGSRRGGFYAGGSGGSASSSGFREKLYGQDQASGHSSSSSNSDYSRTWHTEGSYSQSGQIPPTLIHNSIERDNVPTDRPIPNSRSRGKRMIKEDPSERIRSLVQCKAANCKYIRCIVGALKKDMEVAIALRSRLNVREINNFTSTQAVKISSMIVGKISKLPYGGIPSAQLYEQLEIFTEVPAEEAELVPEVAPLWIYVISAVAGVVMLLLLIWILSKCGFFKRNRPSSAPERQPLNRNGYHSGDEAL